MKIKLIMLTFASLFILAACNDSDTKNQEIEEAQTILEEANQLLSEVKQQQKEQYAQKTKTYKEWVQSCVDKRNQIETSCIEKPTPSAQAGCLVSASKAMGICMAENSLGNIQDKVISEGEELGEILGRTALELEKWAKNNEGELNNLAQGLAPFLEGLTQGDATSSENNQQIQDFLNMLGKSFNESLEKNKK